MNARVTPEPLTGIRHATLQDLPDMDRIEREAFDTPWSRELLRGAIYNLRYDVRVIRPGNQAVQGFYIAHTVHRRGNLDNLAVASQQRQQGLGRRLIDDWIARCGEQNLSSLTLQVNKANTVAQALYADFGFQVRRTLKQYYTNGADALEMELRLSPANSSAPPDPLARYRLRSSGR